MDRLIDTNQFKSSPRSNSNSVGKYKAEVIDIYDRNVLEEIESPSSTRSLIFGRSIFTSDFSTSNDQFLIPSTGSESQSSYVLNNIKSLTPSVSLTNRSNILSKTPVCYKKEFNSREWVKEINASNSVESLPKVSSASYKSVSKNFCEEKSKAGDTTILSMSSEVVEDKEENKENVVSRKLEGYFSPEAGLENKNTRNLLSSINIDSETTFLTLNGSISQKFLKMNSIDESHSVKDIEMEDVDIVKPQCIISTDSSKGFSSFLSNAQGITPFTSLSTGDFNKFITKNKENQIISDENDKSFRSLTGQTEKTITTESESLVHSFTSMLLKKLQSISSPSSQDSQSVLSSLVLNSEEGSEASDSEVLTEESIRLKAIEQQANKVTVKPKRTRIKPIAYWRGDKLLYDNSHNLIGVEKKLHMKPSVKSNRVKKNYKFKPDTSSFFAKVDWKNENYNGCLCSVIFESTSVKLLTVSLASDKSYQDYYGVQSFLHVLKSQKYCVSLKYDLENLSLSQWDTCAIPSSSTFVIRNTSNLSIRVIFFIIKDPSSL